MRRRQLMALLGGMAIAGPHAVRAQQKAMPVIGWLAPTSREQTEPLMPDFRAGLADVGYIEGRNFAIEYRWAESHNDRLPALAAELVARNVDLIFTGALPGALAAMKATSTIPILIVVGVDPVAAGLVKDLAHPDGNLTGFTVFGPRMNIKRFELLSQLVPQARVMAVVTNSANPSSIKSVEQSLVFEPARAKGIQLHLLKASTPDEIDAAFATLAEFHVEGLMLNADPLFDQYKDQVTALAARYRSPAIYYHRRYPDAGGLISYGAKGGESMRPIGAYAGRILAGAKIADLPFQMPTRYELVINRKAATALGLSIPVELETLADEIIE